MNGLFGNFQSPTQFATPQQNVAQYLRMPVAQAAPQQQQYPTMGQFIQAVQQQPPQQDAGLNPLLHIAGYPQVATPQTKPAELTPAEKAIMHISGKYNANTTS